MLSPIHDIQKIVDLLGPGLFLEIDPAAFPTFFGGDIGRETAEINATRFAKEHGCIFFSDGKTAKFGRAYFNQTISK